MRNKVSFVVVEGVIFVLREDINLGFRRFLANLADAVSWDQTFSNHRRGLPGISFSPKSFKVV